jgi:hypothetical protein
MVDLDDLAAFAAERRHNLTGPLRHEQVVALANAWFPEVRFHEDERFHPVDLPGMLAIPPPIFDQLPDSAKDEFRISITTGRLPDGQPIDERFDPPVVHAAAGNVRRVLGSGADAADAMDDLDDLGRGGVFTYGARIEAAREFFGASDTVAGAGEPAPGDPRAPEHLPMVVRAELRMLLETLKHELQLDDLPGELADRGLPIDAIWSGFAVENSFFEQDSDADPLFSRSDKRAILAALVAANEDGEEAEKAALENMELPTGWHFVLRAWEAVKQYAFLEYYLVYAFNDYKEYGTAPFENEHEGDVEGCCVVFERRFLQRLANGTDEADEVIPHTVITSAHEEFQELDDHRPLPEVLQGARDDLVVYVARGSHGMYLDPGPHDILDFEDVVTDLPLQLPTWLTAVGTILRPGLLPMAAVVLGIVEHFVDAEDQTSDNGARIGPEPPDPDPASLEFDKRLEVTPLSDIQDEGDVNIYQDTPALRAALAVRGFPGTWGGDAGLRDKSPPWENKTARYFRRFLQSANIEPAGGVD